MDGFFCCRIFARRPGARFLRIILETKSKQELKHSISRLTEPLDTIVQLYGAFPEAGFTTLGALKHWLGNPNFRIELDEREPTSPTEQYDIFRARLIELLATGVVRNVIDDHLRVDVLRKVHIHHARQTKN